jgi:biopolymer transport protein ExbB/TolQ
MLDPNLDPISRASDERLAVALSEQKLLLERNLGTLGTMAAIAPLVGLLGTVWGIMRAFGDMARVGSAAPSVVASGVAEALVTTAVGLVVAVPALVLYNHFARSSNTMLTVSENHARSLRAQIAEFRVADAKPEAPTERRGRVADETPTSRDTVRAR